MVGAPSNLLALAILVFATLIAVIALVVRLIRSGRVPLLGEGRGVKPPGTQG